MWYISFHGGSGGVNNIQVYHDIGKPHSNPNLLPEGGTNPALSEIRAFSIVDGLLYVVNGNKKDSQVLTYLSTGNGDFSFNEIFASKDVIHGIFHPYDLTFDDQGNCYISSQDSNVVTGLIAPNKVMPVAPFLLQNFTPADGFLDGTRVASSVGQLPEGPVPSPPNVPTPQGLAVNYTDATNTRIAHSVRGVLYYKGSLFVADEPANEVKIYAIQSGELQGQIKGDNLVAPVQLLIHNDVLYIGSTGNKSVVTYDLQAGVQSGVTAPTTFIDGKVKHISGMAFGADGSFYVADRTAKKIVKFPSDGSGDGTTFIDNLPDNPEFILYVPKLEEN